MSKRRCVPVLVIAAALLAACGSSSDPDSSPAASAAVDDAVVAVGVAPTPSDAVGSIGDAVEVAAGAPGQAADAACAADRETLEIAVEAYEVLNGAAPADQGALVTAQLIRELSPRFEVTPDGAVVPAPGSPCP